LFCVFRAAFTSLFRKGKNAQSHQIAAGKWPLQEAKPHEGQYNLAAAARQAFESEPGGARARLPQLVFGSACSNGRNANGRANQGADRTRCD
jgi:hypothetical protein